MIKLSIFKRKNKCSYCGQKSKDLKLVKGLCEDCIDDLLKKIDEEENNYVECGTRAGYKEEDIVSVIKSIKKTSIGLELLSKIVVHNTDGRKDNSDKKELFLSNRHPKKAEDHRKEWSFIKNKRVLENVSYQLQYLEFTIFLYNDYKIYLTIESLLFKNIIVTIANIVEAVLYDAIKNASKDNYIVGDRRDFASLINIIYDMGYIDKKLKNILHCLRKKRNRMHITETDYKEYNAYRIKVTNRYIKLLDKLNKLLRQ